MYKRLTAKRKWITNLNLKVKVKITKSLFIFKDGEKRRFLANLDQYRYVSQKMIRKQVIYIVEMIIYLLFTAKPK